MAKGRKTGGRDFEKGKPGGPGRPKLDGLSKHFKRLTREIVEEIGELVANGRAQECYAIVQNPEETALRQAVAATMLQIIQTGDMRQLDIFINQMAGPRPKPKEDVENEAEAYGKLTQDAIAALLNLAREKK